MSKKTIEEVVDSLVGTVAEILDYKAGVAMGKPPPEGSEMYNPEEMDKLVKLATPLVQGVSQAKIVQAQSTNDVINLVANGKITVKEAEGLMRLMEKKKEMDLVDKLV